MNKNGTPENLCPPWRKGEPSPNPSGRPRRLPISDLYELFANEPIPEHIRKAMKSKGIPSEAGATFAETLAQTMWLKALEGDAKAAKELRESIEGKSPQRIDNPEDNGPATIRVVYDVESK